ncbi:hypothetical protein Z043-121673 [Arapaima gigas]
MSGAPAKLALKREVNLVGAVSLITGIMIGSGIFMSPQLVLQTMGSPGSSLVIWGLCGVLATFGSLCYMELSTIIKESGSEYTYILHTSGPVMAFLFVFTSLFFVGPASTAGIALSFASYIVAPFYEDCVPPELVVKCVAVAGIVVLTIVNGTNVRLSISIQVLFMAAKILSLGIIIIGGVVLLTGGKTSSLENSFEGTHLDVAPPGCSLQGGSESQVWPVGPPETQQFGALEPGVEGHRSSLANEGLLSGAEMEK